MLTNPARVIAKAVSHFGICVIAVGIVMRESPGSNDTALKLPAVETHEMHENVLVRQALSCRLPAESTSGLFG